MERMNLVQKKKTISDEMQQVQKFSNNSTHTT